MKARALFILFTFGSEYTPNARTSADVDETALDKIASDSEKLKQHANRLKCKIQEVRDEEEKLDYRIGVLKQYVTDVDTHFRNNNLEILGVAHVEGEDLLGILRNMSAAIGVPFNEDDVSIVWRNHDQPQGNFAPEVDSIVVRFVSRTVRKQWLQRGRERVVLYSKGCLPGLPESAIYINEHLTKEKKGLVKAAKLLEENGTIPFAWLRDGNVYIRLTPAGKSIKIKSLRDLQVVG